MRLPIAPAALALLLLTPLAASAQQNATMVPASPPRPANELVQEGVKQARAANKNLLVEFGASWCGWCHRFETFLDDSVAGKLMRDNFVVVHLTTLESKGKEALNNPGADRILKEMGATGGIPFFYVLDGSGKKLADSNIMPDGSNVGHPYTPEEIAAFDGFLQKTAPRMTSPQRATIRAYLVRIAAGK